MGCGGLAILPELSSKLWEMTTSYKGPECDAPAFTCPSCHVFAKQEWMRPYDFIALHAAFRAIDYSSLQLASCQHCGRMSVWCAGALIFPSNLPAPPVHADMPLDIAEDYEEARKVLASSPRSAAALLRLCVQKLCISLGEKGENINTDIGNLVAKGLSAQVQQALDIVRVVGNEQVHPGTLDVRDNPEVAEALFSLVNFIVDDRISKPKIIEALYSQLPDSKLKGIEARDKPKP